MPLAFDFFLHFAYVILFLWVMAEQLGVPVPSLPLLLAAGTLTATHKLSLPLVLVAVVAGCFVSDSLWYLLGKRFGGTMVKLVCRLSFERSTCVRKTEDYFTKYGEQALLVAKFVPGLGTVAAPIAGQTGMRYRVFLAYDLAGALFWAATITLIGRFFGDVLRVHPGALSFMGHFAGAIFLLAIAGLLGYRIWKQQAFLKQVRTSRLDPVELKRMLDGGQNPYIVDLRHPLDYLPDPRVLPGAIRLSPESLMQRSGEIPRDRDVILYCTCPSEATAAKMAMKLRQNGIYRVRPLLGGFDQWKKLGYPLEQYEDQPASIA
jgi:membrane protein DedA with SNARE-associated domain/rhodanese-related sulfurtransferase